MFSKLNNFKQSTPNSYVEYTFSLKPSFVFLVKGLNSEKSLLSFLSTLFSKLGNIVDVLLSKAISDSLSHQTYAMVIK